MRRQQRFVAMFALLGVASVVVAIVSVSLSLSRSTTASTPSADTRVVQRYYEAVNHMIATGNPSLLRKIVDPEMIELEGATSGKQGLAGIEHHLAFLHRATPDAQIVVDLMTGKESQITALVTIRRSSSSTMLGFGLDDRAVLWPEVERFRVVGGRIVERTATWDSLAILETESDLPFENHLPNDSLVTASLNNFAPQSIGQYLSVDIPAFVRVLSGEVSIQMSDVSKLSGIVIPPDTSGGEGTRYSILPGYSETVTPGSVAIIPPGIRFAIANEQSRPASVLVVSVQLAPSPAEVLEGDSSPLQHGILEKPLASHEQLDRSGETQITFGTASLMPGGRLNVASSTKLMVVCSVSGSLRCTTYETGAERDGIVRIDQFEDSESAQIPILLLARDAGETILVNAGDEAATAWVLAIS